MAEALLLPLVISGAASLLQKALTKLWTRFQQAKVTDAEFRELQDFMQTVHELSTLHAPPSSGVKSVFRQRLEDAKNKLEEWCSENSRFFSWSSDERLRELRVQRESVKTAIDMEMFRMVGSIYKFMKEPNPRIAPSKATTSTNPVNTNLTSKTKVDATRRLLRSRSKSTDRGIIFNSAHSRSQLPPSSTSRSRSVGRKPTKSVRFTQPSTTSIVEASNSQSSTKTRPSRSIANASSALSTSSASTAGSSSGSSTAVRAWNHSSNQVGKTHAQQRWHHLWVPIYSDFQAEEVKKRLEGFPDVQRVICDQPIHKVSVKLREGSHVGTDTLLEHARQDIPYKLPPTRWVDRSR